MVYDVAIVGAGLAGLTLAEQLLQENPEISICILHDSSFPNEKVAFKVGEATIDMGGHYLRKIFGKDYLDQECFLKMAMRFINTESCSDYREMGISAFPAQDSYHFERGKLENDAFNLVKNRVNVLQNTRFLDVEDEDTLKRIEIINTSTQKKDVILARWLVDASGFQKILTKKYDLSVKQYLPNSSVWFRVDGAVLVDEIYPSKQPDVFRGIDRSISSLHIDGKGYWIWVLRLSQTKTSVGICFSEAIYPMEDLSTLEKTFGWLKQHELTFYNYLIEKEFPILDFKYLRKYAKVSSLCISPNHFALTGDACAFVDPVYSGGVDIICMCNTTITKVITRDLANKNIDEYIKFYNQFLVDYVNIYNSCLKNMYENKDNWYYIFVKYMADCAIYFGGVCPFIMNDTLDDLEKSKEGWNIVMQMIEVYDEILQIINKKEFKQHSLPSHINLTDFIFSRLSTNILSPQGNLEDLMLLLRDNLKVIKKFKEYVSEDKNLIDLYSPKFSETTQYWEDWRYRSFFDRNEIKD